MGTGCPTLQISPVETSESTALQLRLNLVPQKTQGAGNVNSGLQTLIIFLIWALERRLEPALL